jgi:hypothetical protein
MGALKIIQQWYDDDFQDVRSSLFVTMFNAYHMIGYKVYRVHQGNPSGNPLTVIINSMVNSLLSRIVWILLSREAGLGDNIHAFSQYVRLANYGDDNLVCVSPLVPWYNQKTISNALRKYGIEYTSASKEQICSDYTLTNDIEYLKRKFQFRNGYWYAPLKKASIQEALSWKRGDTDEDLTLKCTWYNMVIEAAMHGKPYFETFKDTVISKANSVNIKLPTFTYHDINSHIIYGKRLWPLYEDSKEESTW